MKYNVLLRLFPMEKDKANKTVLELLKLPHDF
jgi:hypothetical protein